MESQLLSFYEHNKENSNISNLATEYLLRDTLSKNLMGVNKIKDVDGMDMESNINGKIIPGMIYTFQYKPIDVNNDVIESLNLGDNFPIVLCCNVKLFNKNINGKSVKSLCIQGINLNMITKKNRLILLDLIHRSYLDFYENDVYKHAYNNTVAINDEFAFLLNNSNVLKVFLELSNTNLNSCFRTYDVTRCKNIRLIEYNLWKYIPFYNPKRYILNLSKEQIEQIKLMLNQ